MSQIEHRQQDALAAADLQIPPGPAHAVLFVDDEEGVLAALRRSLRREPYIMACATSGPQALDLLKQQDFQVIVTDMGMPDMDGLSLLNTVSIRHPDILRLVLSASSDAIRILDAINKGRIHQYILKPWEDEDLKIRLRQTFELWDLQAEKQCLLSILKKRNQTLEDEVNNRIRQIMAVERQAAMGRYAAQIVHNLNNPLHALSGTLELLTLQVGQERPDKDKIDRSLSIAKSSADDLRVMIASILPTDGQQDRFTRRPVDINGVIEKEIVYFDMMPEFKYEIDRRLILQETIPPVLGNAIQIKQILDNLIKNALDAMENSSQKLLTIETRQENKNVIIRIADTGEGISEENLDRIFLPDFTTKPLGKGTGLGLASVKAMVEAYAGSLSVESTVARGTTFTVKLPGTMPDGQSGAEPMKNTDKRGSK